MIYWNSTEVWLNLVAPLDSGVPLSKSMFFELPVLISLALYLIRSVSAEVSLNCISRIRFKCSFFWPWENQYMVHGFDSISITQFPAMICSVSAEGSLNRRLTRFRSFFFWLWGNHFCLICVHLLLVYHSAQLSHTWSDFSRSLRVMISETRILFHFILVLLSSTLMKQLTCNVSIISLISTLGLDI